MLQVLEAGMDELPSWLTWDNKSSTLYGVADEEDLGPHYISVTAYGAPINDTHTSLAKDVFTIDVRHETQTSFKHSSLRWDECETNDPTVVTASLLLDVPLRSLKPKEKLFVISKTSEILNFDNTDVAPRLRLLTYDYLSTFHKRDILSSSVTNVDVKNRKNAVLVIFLACGSTVSKSAASFIKNLQTKIDDGRFSAALMNFRVLDLEIASGKVVVRKKRRQASQVNPSGSFGQTTIEVETPPIPTRPAVTVVRISTTTTFRYCIFAVALGKYWQFPIVGLYILRPQRPDQPTWLPAGPVADEPLRPLDDLQPLDRRRPSLRLPLQLQLGRLQVQLGPLPLQLQPQDLQLPLQRYRRRKNLATNDPS